MAVNPKGKTAIVGLCSILLVAMVVALMFSGKTKDEPAEPATVSSSQKAVANLCQNTDYQDTCVETLTSSGDGKETSDPKELMERAFRATVKDIREAAHDSALFRDLERDPRGKSALDSCEELANRAIADLERSLDKFSNFDFTTVDSILSDLKIWLSGALTYQETCLDGFEGVEGDAGERMQELLTKGMQMTSNGLAMVNEVASVFESIVSPTFSNRRLLSDAGSLVLGHEDDIPDWIDPGRRKLLSDAASLVLGHEDDIPDWIDAGRRKLLMSARLAKVRADIVVAKDGSGNFTTVNEAVANIPKNRDKTFVVYVKEGVYEEKVVIGGSLTHVLLIGDGPTKTKITGRLNFIDGTNTYQTATVAVQGDHFTAKDIGFENYAGAEKHQAVALRVSGDLAIFFNCRMDGYQDTLYAHTYRQFYRDCTITGTIDFVFGDSAAVFQGCTFVVRKPLPNQSCIVTAQGRKDLRQPTGLVLQNCSFVADPEYFPLRHTNKAYLGRPWKEFSRTIILESFLDDLIQPEGWLPWNENFALDTLFYTEFNNRGPGASKTGRVTWAGVKELPAKRMRRFTANEFIEAKRWVRKQGVPYEGGFFFPLPAEEKNSRAYSPEGPEENKDIGGSKDKSSYIGHREPSSTATSAVPVSSIAAAPESSYLYVEAAASPSPSPLPSPYNNGNNSNNDDKNVAAASTPPPSPASKPRMAESGRFFGLW